jgi:hypothetical protein
VSLGEEYNQGCQDRAIRFVMAVCFLLGFSAVLSLLLEI